MDDMLRELISKRLNWQADDVVIEYAGDGLTNKNYIVSNEKDKAVVRMGAGQSSVLGIRRATEYQAAHAAAIAGIGPALIYFDEQRGDMITEFIPGKLLSQEGMITDNNICLTADCLKKLHELLPIPGQFSPYRDIQTRIQYAKERGLYLPKELALLLEKLNTIEKMRENQKNQFIRLCHNDPFPNNFIMGDRLWLIDYEYAGMGDLYFDLVCASMFYNEEQTKLFLCTYFGAYTEEHQQNMEQMKFVVTFWNAMWAVVMSEDESEKEKYEAMARGMFESIFKTVG